MDSVLIRLVDMGFNGMLSDFHCRYKGTTCDLNQSMMGARCSSVVRAYYPVCGMICI